LKLQYLSAYIDKKFEKMENPLFRGSLFISREFGAKLQKLNSAKISSLKVTF